MLHWREYRCLCCAFLAWSMIDGVAGLSDDVRDAEGTDKPAAAIDELQNTFLEWISPETETMIVSKGPFVVRNPHARDMESSLAEQLETEATARLFSLRDGKYGQALCGQTVLLALEGSYHFRFPFGLGGFLYDGCHIFVFDENFKTAGDEFILALRADVDRIYQHSGCDVFAFDEEWELERWTLFVCRPKANVLLVATSRRYLSGALSAMQHKPRIRAEWQKRRRELPEWENVDSRARFWAIRHFDPGNATHDTTNPHSKFNDVEILDTKAIGLTFSYEPSKRIGPHVRFLSTNADRETFARKQWAVGEKLSAIVQVVNPNFVNIRFSLDRPVKVNDFMFILYQSLGHGIAI